MEKEVQLLVDRFKKAAIAHHAFTLEGNWRKGNAEVKKITAAFEKLKKFNNIGREALLSLTDDQDPVVSANAAVYSLKYNEEKCLMTLERIKTLDIPFISSGAAQTIENWKNGEWHIE